jgi:hypothetical protein
MLGTFGTLKKNGNLGAIGFSMIPKVPKFGTFSMMVPWGYRMLTFVSSNYPAGISVNNGWV